MFSIKDPKTITKPDGIGMLLNSLGLTPDKLLAKLNDNPAFLEMKRLITDFTATIERSHAEVMLKLGLLHADVRALNPDHAGALDEPVLTEDLADKIDSEHYRNQSTEFKDWFCMQPLMEYKAAKEPWMEYRKNARANPVTN